MSTPPSKEKTRAKLRYLKAKKERKKKRKALPSNRPSKPEVEEGEFDAVDPDGQEPSHTLNVEAESLQGREQTPRKRRKTSQVDESADRITLESPAAKPVDRSPTPHAALPSFPLPILPDTPEKSTLALQGLDKALLDAEIVDPARVEPVGGLERPDGQLPVLSEKTKERLHDLGITEFFAIQTTLLPFLLPPQRRLRHLYCPYDPPRDVCASAPTGSGKTLAYVIPIVEILSARIATRLRALIVLPTRDLVAQVQETFEALCKGRGLKIGVATGQHSFAHEQNQLVADQNTRLQGGSSKVDILICTPGRLIDHLNGTPNFTLQHLRFLVIDEADRLLAQSFQDWLSQVLAATRPPPRPARPILSASPRSARTETDLSVPYHDAMAPAWIHASDTITDFRTDVDDKKESSCQKLLFSATLTRDPSKIAAIELRNPKYFIVQGSGNAHTDDIPAVLTDSFAMPSTLKEHMLVCETSQKPLMLFHLVHAHSVTNALVFTKSAESTTRLVRLFDFFERAWASEQSGRRATVARAYSSDLDRSERRALLEQFRAGEIDILVCSDLISRGIDISHVSHVVSYDAPVDVRKYVHRVGRTARAGRSGDAWTLIETHEAHYFKTMMGTANHLDQVKKAKVSEKDVAALVPHYDTALNELKEVYSRSNG